MRVIKAWWERLWYGSSKSMSHRQICRRLARGETGFRGKFHVSLAEGEHDPKLVAEEYDRIHKMLKSGQCKVMRFDDSMRPDSEPIAKIRQEMFDKQPAPSLTH